MKILPKDIVRDALKIGDLLHTVGGGISETTARVKHWAKGAVIHVSAAGVNPQSFKVMLQNNRLTVVSEFHNPENPGLRIPVFTRIWELPQQVNLSRIEAIYEDGELQIRLPYHSGTNELKLIKIKHRE